MPTRHANGHCSPPLVAQTLPHPGPNPLKIFGLRKSNLPNKNCCYQFSYALPKPSPSTCQGGTITPCPAMSLIGPGWPPNQCLAAYGTHPPPTKNNLHYRSTEISISTFTQLHTQYQHLTPHFPHLFHHLPVVSALSL